MSAENISSDQLILMFVRIRGQKSFRIIRIENADSIIPDIQTSFGQEFDRFWIEFYFSADLKKSKSVLTWKFVDLLCITKFTFPDRIRIVCWIQSWTSSRRRYIFSFFVSSFFRMQKISLDSRLCIYFWRGGDIVYRSKTQLSFRVETWVRLESLNH